MDQELRPALGLRPWLAFLRRTLAFFFCVRFDIGERGYPRPRVALQTRPTRLPATGVGGAYAAARRQARLAGPCARTSRPRRPT